MHTCMYIYIPSSPSASRTTPRPLYMIEERMKEHYERKSMRGGVKIHPLNQRTIFFFFHIQNYFRIFFLIHKQLSDLAHVWMGRVFGEEWKPWCEESSYAWWWSNCLSSLNIIIKSDNNYYILSQTILLSLQIYRSNFERIFQPNYIYSRVWIH